MHALRNHFQAVRDDPHHQRGDCRRIRRRHAVQRQAGIPRICEGPRVAPAAATRQRVRCRIRAAFHAGRSCATTRLGDGCEAAIGPRVAATTSMTRRQYWSGRRKIKMAQQSSLGHRRRRIRCRSAASRRRDRFRDIHSRAICRIARTPTVSEAVPCSRCWMRLNGSFAAMRSVLRAPHSRCRCCSRAR